MLKTIQSPQVYMQHTGTGRGRGVFAARPFREGDVVEECPVIVLDQPFSRIDRRLQLVVFDWGTLTGTDAGPAVALGYGSIYNHADPANLACTASEPVSGSKLLTFTAVRDIEADEELTINYNAHDGGHTWHDNNWFDRMNVAPLE